MYLISVAIPVLLSLCTVFGITFVTLSLVSNKLEILGTCKVSCLICVLNMLVLLGVYDNFDSVRLWIDVIGIQWYWMSSGIDISNIYNIILGNCWTTFVSVILITPCGNLIFVLGAIDVIHSITIVFSIIRADVIPGRICFVYLNMHLTGLFLGQCSEICGILHGAMSLS